jgi:dihydrofolate reductase
VKPLAMIAAMTEDRIIGKGGKLPWRLPDDMKHFKATTMGHAIIMGRKTWEETGRPLPGRRNLVVTSRAIDGVETFRTIEAAIDAARTTDREPFVIGGGEIYRAALPYATKLVVTWVKGAYEGDTRFPEVPWPEWKEVERRAGEAFDIAVYERI